MEEPVTPRPAHLMCRRPRWGVAGFAVCAYFAYAAFAGLRGGDFYWASGWWIVLTWAVWVVFAAGLLTETRCWREAIVFALLLLVLLLGVVFSVWTSARPEAIREAREASLVLWSLAALASLLTIRSSAFHE